MTVILIVAVIFAVLRVALTPRAVKRPPTPAPSPMHLSEMALYRPYQFTDYATAVTGEAPTNFYLADLLQHRAEPAPEVLSPDVAAAHTAGASVPFKPHEPQSFDEFEAQRHITRPLQAAVRALAPNERVISHRLLTGLPGRGKTLLARILAYELQSRAERLGLLPLPFFETYAANFSSVEDFDRLVHALVEAGGGIWFIDELHVLPRDMATKIYALMEDGRYPFAGSTTPTAVPDVVIIGATTDYGSLHDALKRRFGEPHMVRALNRTELADVVRRAAPIDEEAVAVLVERTHWSGAPWEAVSLTREAHTFAKAEGQARVRVADVQTVLDTYEIDALGLRWIDRQVLHVLRQRPRYRGKAREFVCYAASEGDVCAVVGLDPAEYRAAVKPRLLTRGLLQVVSGYGQALTPRAIEWLDAAQVPPPSPSAGDHPPHS